MFFTCRDGEGTSATPSARNIHHCQENDGLGSEANTARKTDVNTQELEVNPDKVTVSPANTTGGLATVSARTEENAYQERAALLEKVDLELFQWPKFLISLSRKEKEDDFFAIKGAKLPQRPKKRLKHVEKALHVSKLDHFTFCSVAALLSLTAEEFDSFCV